jgi:signal transduction histidine kinase/ActR/RegA family two-component response regulator
MERFRARWRESTVDELAAAAVWRSRLLDVLLLVAFGLGLVVAIPSIAYAVSVEQWAVVVVDVIALLAVAVLALVPSIPYRVRAISFLTVAYLLGVFLFVAVGPVLAAYFLAVPVLAAVLLGTRAAVVALGINAITTGLLGLVSPLEPLVVGDESMGATASWLLVVMNFVFVNALITLSTAALISRLERSLALNRRLAVAVERSPNGIAIADASGALVYVNSAAVDLLGPEASRARTLSELVPEVQPALPDPLPAGGHEGSIALVGDVGTIRVLEVEIRRLRDTFGEGEAQQVAIVRDVTELRAMQDEMARSQRLQALGTLVGGTAHDFNNALGAVVGLSQLLRSDLDDAEQLAIVDDILLAADRARGVVGQLMAFGRVGSRPDESTDIGDVLAHELPLLATSMPRHVELVLDAADGLLVPLSPAEIHQVVTNLVTNACHALSGRSSGTVRVELTRIDDDATPTARLTVTDDGHGIAPELLPTVFDPFVTTKPPGEGTGLGLASVHGIVTAAGGGVDISSTRGVGTTVEVVLPAALATRPTMPTTPVEGRTPAEQTSLLIVDDEQLIVSSTSRLLERRGYRVTECTDPIEARELLETGADFDVILTDMSMPTMSGLALAQVVRTRLPDAAIVVMSGYGEVMTAEDRQRLGIAAAIDKPFTIDDLAACLERVRSSQS